MARERPPTYGQVGPARGRCSRPSSPATAGRYALLPSLLLLTLLLLPLAHATPVAGDELPLGVTVTVVAPADQAYGAGIADAHRALYGEHALGPPDGQGAILLNGGQLVVEFADVVADCRAVNVWATQAGWGRAGLTIHASADGRGWRRLGAAEAWDGSAPLTLPGDGGEVRYLRLSRTGGWLAVLLVDAVGAEGVIDRQQRP